MAKKLNNVEEIEETEKAEETEVETKSEGLAAKVKDGVKKHGKKVAIGVAALFGLGLAYALGKKSGADDEDDEDCEDYDTIEVEFSTVDDPE